MNRHERRKAAAQARVTRDVFEIEIIGGSAVLDEPGFMQAAIHWARQIETVQPLCLHCQHTWTLLTAAPPSAFVFVHPWQQPVLNGWRISAVCDACFQLPDLRARCLAAIQRKWPGRIIAIPHSCSETMQ